MFHLTQYAYVDQWAFRLTASKMYKVNIHLRSMKTGKSHPGTSTPVISHTTRLEDVDRCGFFIRTVEDRLGLLYHPYHHIDHPVKDELCIWNWKTGELLSVSQSFPPSSCPRQA